MSAGKFIPYSTAIEKIVANTLRLPHSEFYAVLLRDDYKPNKTAHGTYSSVKDYLCKDTDHRPVPVQNVAVERNGDTINIVCGSPISFGDSVTISAKYFLVVAGKHSAPTDDDSLLGYCDLRTEGGLASSTTGPFVVTVDPSGLFSIGN